MDKSGRCLKGFVGANGDEADRRVASVCIIKPPELCWLGGCQRISTNEHTGADPLLENGDVLKAFAE